LDSTQVNAYGEILSWRNMHMVLGAHWALLPAAMVTVGTWSPTGMECALVFSAWLALASLSLTMNHRYFAHCAFKTSRPFRAVCAGCACLGLQYGPLWWSSKHRKHHKLCDLPGDPHSWRETSWWYAWFGWVTARPERHIELDYLHQSMFTNGEAFQLPAWLTPCQSTGPAVKENPQDSNVAVVTPNNGRAAAWELLLIDKLWWLPSLAVYLALWLGAGCSQRTCFFYFVGPSLCLPLPILLFNVMFHPPDNAPTKSGCFALDSMLDPLSVLLGEAAHEDHHVFPDRAKRPSTLPGGFDLSYAAILVPLQALGLIWEPKSRSLGALGKSKHSREHSNRPSEDAGTKALTRRSLTREKTDLRHSTVADHLRHRVIK
jgi:stearoyl-CoA desaturase (delta-9 desaturase)